MTSCSIPRLCSRSFVPNRARIRSSHALKGARIGAVNLSEVVAKLVDDGVPETEIRRAIDRLELDVHAFDVRHAHLAGVLREGTRALGLALGDRACLALAQSLGAPALTADRSWSRLDLGIAI
jgi:ribonuclease VapC